jgi:hypothetical protein
MSTIDERLRGLDTAPSGGYGPAFAPFVRFGDQIQLSGRPAISFTIWALWTR